MPIVRRFPTLLPFTSLAETCVVGTMTVGEGLNGDLHSLSPSSTLPHLRRLLLLYLFFLIFFETFKKYLFGCVGS